jgi:hypothetical protein
MNTLLGLLGSALFYFLLAWVLGTFIWMILVVPGMHKRQTEMLRRLNALERRLAASDMGIDV